MMERAANICDIDRWNIIFLFLLLQEMDTKFESRQFPATFPETFKDFFSMINEEEDHVEFISNILEDKVMWNDDPHKFFYVLTFMFYNYLFSLVNTTKR